MNDVILKSIYALIATLGFAILFNIRGKNLFFTSIGGAIGWFVYSLFLYGAFSKIASIFLASIALSIYSEICARILKTPVTVFLICALIPLVPGAGMYYSMLECVKGNITTSLFIGIETLSLAVTISIAAMLVSSITKVIISIHTLRATSKRNNTK